MTVTLPTAFGLESTDRNAPIQRGIGLADNHASINRVFSVPVVATKKPSQIIIAPNSIEFVRNNNNFVFTNCLSYISDYICEEKNVDFRLANCLKSLEKGDKKNVIKVRLIKF